eukprot:6196962-Pleurochrysis_carterae.AAC.2
MPPAHPRSTRSPCTDVGAQPAFASGLGQSCGAKHSGRRCRNRRPRGRSRPRWLHEETSAAALRTPSGWAGRVRSQFCPGAFAS